MNIAELLHTNRSLSEISHYKWEFLHGGISNINIIVKDIDIYPSPVVITFYKDGGSSNINREFQLREILDADCGIPIPKIYDAGVVEDTNGTYGYVVKECLEGQTLHQTLAEAERLGLSDNDITSLLHGLGETIARFHSHVLPGFGDIPVEPSVLPWRDIYIEAVKKRFADFMRLPSEKQISQFRVSQIQTLLPSLSELIDEQADSFDGVIEPRLTHNDMNFLNVLSSRKNGTWGISGLLDFDDVSSADPDIDLVAVESQIYLSTYKEPFMKHRSDFCDGYRMFREINSQTFRQKRLIYHMSRSLSYFEAIVAMDETATQKHEINNFFAEKHLEILKSIAEHGDLNTADMPMLF
jgi:Ser/Thr protein kinase RdoA (MazF antagonist)